MKILSIESTCDDSSIAILEDHKLIYHKTYTQNQHAKTLGVVPEIAARIHYQNFSKIMEELISKFDLNEIDLISYSNRPGMPTSLLVGQSFANSLGIILNKKVLPINHLQAHCFSPFINSKNYFNKFYLLIISGANTIIAKVNNFKFKILEQSTDGAIGNSLDKVAKLLNLGYPGGKIIDNIALRTQASDISLVQDIKKLSFSGIHTKFKDFVISNQELTKPEIAFCFQKTLFNIVLIRLRKLVNFNEKLVIVGGVSANSYFKDELKNNYKKIFFPKKEFSTDNAAMIGYYSWLIYNININQNNNFFDIFPKAKLNE